MPTAREWTLYWEQTPNDPAISLTKVKGPLLMPKDEITVIEKERFNLVSQTCFKLINALGHIGRDAKDESIHAVFARDTLRDLIKIK